MPSSRSAWRSWVRKANRLFGLTLLLAYGTTTISGFLTFFIGKAFLPSLIKPITGDVLESNAFEPFFTIEVTPIFGVMTALVLAFVLGIGMANLKGDPCSRFSVTSRISCPACCAA